MSFGVPTGEVLGIAGPNGAGKSTLIALLLGMLAPDEGRLALDGLSPRRFVEREGVAYLPELMTFPLEWRTVDALRRMAALAGIVGPARTAAVERVIDTVGIGEHRGKRLKQLSKGNLQRLGLAQALLAERRVVIFDEPTHGLDPVWTARFRDIVAGLRRADRAIVVASHNLDELERICDRVAIIDRGEIQRIVAVRSGGTDDVPRLWRVRCARGAEALVLAFAGATVRGDSVELTADLPALNRGLAAAIAGGALVSGVTPAESSLEQAFRSAVTPR